jgi:DNA-binding transcriptional LysR family regulator
MDSQLAVLAVAEKGSYSAAGKVLAMTGSAVRKQVEGVSRDLGAPIFQRSGGILVPTKAGRLYIPEVRESIRHARLGIDKVRAYLKAERGKLRIGYSSYLSEKLLRIITKLSPDGNGAVGLRSLLTYQVVSDVLRGRLHVGFGFLPLRDASLVVRPLMEEPLMVCFPQGHKLLAKQTIDATDLENEPVIAVARKALPARHREIVNYFESEGVFLKHVADAYVPREALLQVSHGVGVAMMTRSSAMPARPDVILRPLSNRYLTVKSGVFARKEQDTAYIREFLDLVWQATAGLRPAAPRKKAG